MDINGIIELAKQGNPLISKIFPSFDSPTMELSW